MMGSQEREGVCYLVGAAPLCALPVPEEGDLVIAVDGGYRYLAESGIVPHLAVGDFDSLGYVPQGAFPVVSLPVEKDETDLAFALELGRKRGFRRFVLLGGTGGREDHTLANIALLYHAAERGCRAFLVGDGFTRTVIVNDSLHLKPNSSEDRRTFSVFSLKEISRGVTVSGGKYALSEGELLLRVSLGVSNSFQGKPVDISVREGALLVMWEGEELLPLG